MPQSSTMRVGVLEVFKGLSIFGAKTEKTLDSSTETKIESNEMVSASLDGADKTRQMVAEQGGVKHMALE